MESTEKPSQLSNELKGHLPFTQADCLLGFNIFQHTPEGIMVTDDEHRILDVNLAFTDVTGFTREEAIGSKPSILSSGRHDEAFYRKIWDTIAKKNSWQGEIWNRKKTGEVYLEWLSISAAYDESGRVTNYIGVFSDITARKQLEDRLSYLATHDALTGLPNRVLFKQALTQSIARAHRNQSKLAVLFLDLDRFKEINDSLGHSNGDLLLEQVAQRLTKAVRDEDTVARLSGDEFTVILENLPNEDAAILIAKKILETFKQPFNLNGHQVTVTISIGISLYPANGEEFQELINKADQAMYEAKRQERNNYSLAGA